MAKNFQNVKSIEANVTFYGNGLVNGDSNEQAKYLRAKDLLENKNENLILSKKVFYNENGVTKFKHKVSTDTLRNAMFKKFMPCQNSALMMVPIALYNAIATPAYIARGYMFADKKASAKKRSIFTITSPIADMPLEDRVHLDFCSTSGDRGKKDVETGESSTSIHSVESVGEYKYKSDLFIDLMEAQFISLDDLYDRNAAFFDIHGAECREEYFNALKRNFELNEKPEIKNYCLGTSVYGDCFSEEGIKLPKEAINKIVHTTLESLIDLYVTRASRGALFKFLEMELTVNYGDGQQETLTIKSKDDIKDVNFFYEDAYVEADKEQVLKRKEIVEKYKEQKKAEKIAEQEARKLAKAAKNKKNNETENQ